MHVNLAPFGFGLQASAQLGEYLAPHPRTLQKRIRCTAQASDADLVEGQYLTSYWTAALGKHILVILSCILSSGLISRRGSDVKGRRTDSHKWAVVHRTVLVIYQREILQLGSTTHLLP